MVDNNSTESGSILTELVQLQAMVEEISTSLKSQRDILKVRGIKLPPLTMQTLSKVKTEITSLEKTMVNEQTELGQLRSLADNAAMINQSFDLDNILQQAMDITINLTGAERGFIIMVDPQTGDFDFRVTVDNSISTRRGGSSEPQISHGVVREVLETGKPLLADNAYKDERLQGNLSVAQLTLRSVLCVPLHDKSDNVLGVVYVDNRLREGVFEEGEKRLLAAFANQVSVAMENANLFNNIQQSVDEITEVKELTDNVFESIGSGVITTDSSDLVMTFNRAAAKILNRHDRDAVIGQNLRQILTNFGVGMHEKLEMVRNTGEPDIFDAEIDIEGKGSIYTSMKMSPLRDSADNTQGVAIVIDDVTEQQERGEILTIMKRYLPPEMVDNIHTISSLALGGEKRDVTCMFVDVRPLSTLPEGMRPPELMEMVNTYLAVATDCVHQNKGVIDKYMGNEIMALFNTQLNPMDNHAEQAIESALSIRDAFIHLYARLGINPDPHFYRIGIHTGVATLGNVGSWNRRDFTAIGDTINLSKRIEENSTDGQIRISDSVRNHVDQTTPDIKQRVYFEEREPIKAKGKTQATINYEIFRV